MAHTATNSASHLSLGALLIAPLAAVGRFLVQIGENSSRARMVERLSMKTDAELAELGIAREDIVRYVFRDYIGL